MKITADYHTHTIYSHGKGTIRENVESAINKGLKEIAICDHGPGHMGFGVKKRDIIKMRREIDNLNSEYDNINILLGLECNIIGYDGTVDIDKDILKYLDILLVGFHFGARPKSFKDAYKMYVLNYMGKFSEKIAKRARDLNTTAVINAINKYDIDLITHPGAKVDIDSKKLARAAAKSNTALEINSSHGQLSLEYINLAKDEGVKFVISSDAHDPRDVGRVDKGIERAASAGLTEEQVINGQN